MAKDEASKEAREKEKQMIIESLSLHNGDSAERTIEQHNNFVKYAVNLIEILRDRSHDILDFRSAVEGALKIAISGQDEMKKEHRLLREEVTELKIIGKTSLTWLKALGTIMAFMISVGVLGAIIKLLAG